LAYAQNIGVTAAPPSTAGNNPSGAAAGLDALTMLINLSKSYPYLTMMATGACYVIGMSLAIRAIYYLKVYGELRTMMSTQSSLKIPVTYIVASAVFLFIPTAISVFDVTVFGTSSPIGYDATSSSINPIILKAVGGFVQLLGIVSFIRGWLMLVANAQSPGGGHASFGKAMTHIVGGFLLINIYALSSVIWNTFGLSF
jgi:intracellular multiplication protein IcmC